MRRFFICMLLVLAMALPVNTLAETTAAPAANETGALRVYLKSLGAPTQLNVTLAGSYSLNGKTGFRFKSGTTLGVSIEDGAIWLDCGGISICAGDTLTLTRHRQDGENGLYISGSQRGGLYGGSLEISLVSGALMPVLIIDIEEYLKGVVPYEMSDSFPIEALKAQAVAARTYALRRRADRGDKKYDVVDTTADQVYFGYSADYANAIAAVEATKGLCARYNGDYAVCYYTATNGGQTARAGDILSAPAADAYLDVRDDPYDLENSSSPVTTLAFSKDMSDAPEQLKSWLISAAAEQLSAMGYSDETSDVRIERVTAIEDVNPKSAAPARDYQAMRFSYTVSARPLVPVYEKPAVSDAVFHAFTGTPMAQKIIGYEPGDWESVDETFTCDISVYDQLKNRLGLKISAIDCELATAIEEDDLFIIQLRRYGHGVGMSQRGAQTMAGSHGMDFRAILGFYYPGLTIEAVSLADATADALNGAKAAAAVQDDAAILGAPGDGEYMAVVTLSTAASTLNLRAQPSTDAAVIGVLSGGAKVIVMDEANGWAHVRATAGEGYVSAQYIKAAGSAR